MASSNGALSHSFVFFLLAVASICDKPISAHQAAIGPAAALKPAPVAPGLRTVLLDETRRRRRLGSFQICALCTCCGGPKGLCLPSPCCYAINCNIPNRPFGFCSFTPKTCNCFGCHL